MNDLTVQELMVGLTLVLTLINIWNGRRQAKIHETATNPAIVAIEKDAMATRKDVQYIREAMDARAASDAAINQRIDGVVKQVSMLDASVETLRETVKIMQKAIDMQQNMILKIQGRGI